jgi:RNA recognition motif-containing protein
MSAASGLLSSTLFLGDLSIYCQEKDLFQLCSKFGAIAAIKIKRNDNGQVRKPHLSYGFVKFRFIESARTAFTELNGLVYLGRPIR